MPSRQSCGDTCHPTGLAFQEGLIGYTLRLMGNNTSVVAYNNKQREAILSSLYILTRQVLAWGESNSVTLVACYTSGPWDVVADQLSCLRQVIGTEWSLRPLVVPRAF